MFEIIYNFLIETIFILPTELDHMKDVVDNFAVILTLLALGAFFVGLIHIIIWLITGIGRFVE